jgi:hypothetical protein
MDCVVSAGIYSLDVPELLLCKDFPSFLKCAYHLDMKVAKNYSTFVILKHYLNEEVKDCQAYVTFCICNCWLIYYDVVLEWL